MATNTLNGLNQRFPIYNADGTPFHDLVMNKAVVDSIIMSLGDKITGDVYYINNNLTVTMREYVLYNGVKYVLVTPPTILREGMVSDNSELKGLTKYSFTFYHPMYVLGNFPFSDVAVSLDQRRYLSQNKEFAWIGRLPDFVAKINKNLEGTEWICRIGSNVTQEELTKLSEVLAFDKNTVAEALKTGYETWGVPYIVDTLDSTDSDYASGKRYLIQFGLPTTDILVKDERGNDVPFVFHFGQGVGLKNNSRTPRNNKIVTRISGYGSEDNIQYGYPQIPYEGGDVQYPLYDGIVNGQKVQLIKHPFTRTHLMPSIYRETVNKKVNPMAVGYDPNIEIKDYYDADNTYTNPIKPSEPSYEIHEFEDIKPELGEKYLTSVSAYDGKSDDAISMVRFLSLTADYFTESDNVQEKEQINALRTAITTKTSDSGSVNTDTYKCNWSFTSDDYYSYVTYVSSGVNFEYTILRGSSTPSVDWDDTMDDDGNYLQSYFKVKIPQLSFDLYPCAAVTQEMTINMRSGACLGCSFPVMVDWDDYKRNFYDENGDFAPDGSQRDYTKYPNSKNGAITLVLQKETSTFGTLMPNIYQQPRANDQFVILGISLPQTYITEAEQRLDADMKQYMRDNNEYYFDYPLKFDEHFLAKHTNILQQMKNNVIVRFDYAGEVHALYIKQMTVKYENKPLPTYDITLTDDIEIVLNQIGQVTDEVSKLRLIMGQGGGGGVSGENYLRKDIDDTAAGTIRMIKGLQVGERFVSGLLGEGAVMRKEADGTTYLECDKLYVRMKAYFDSVEIRKFLHSAGNRIASSAGMKCSRVEYIDANGGVTENASQATKFRCYFRANDDGKEVTNDFVVGDLAFCKETNASVDSGVEQHGYWRAVVGRNAEGTLTESGEGWIDLSASDCLAGSGIPIAQDDIVQLGNKTDTSRQGAIIEYVSGADSPSYQIFQGINTYSLENKNYVGLGYNSQTGRAYLNVFGDTYIGDRNGSSYIQYNAANKTLNIKAAIEATSTIGGKTIAQYITDNTWSEDEINSLIDDGTKPLEETIAEIQKQVDGSIETWFYNGVPSAFVLPESEWKAIDTETGGYNERLKHLGDLYYDNESGYAYRYVNQGTEERPQFTWVQLTDSAVTTALQRANAAQDTADHKRRVFLVQPTPPYDAGDLWVNATYPSGNRTTDAAANKYYNDVLRCGTSKASGTQFAISDWTLASKYTDDSSLNDFKLNSYVQQLTNGTITGNISAAQTAANNAEAHAATFDAIKQALNNGTLIDGGMVLSTLIGLRDSNNKIWSGISGAYSAGAKGGGIAAWYGGAMVDHEVNTTATDYAKSLFRFDGSGYVAHGNISWDTNGAVTIQGTTVDAATLKIGGIGISDKFVTLDTAQTISGVKTFSSHVYIVSGNLGIGTATPAFKLHVNGSTRTNKLYLTDTVYLEYDTANNGVHIVGAGLYSDTFISAFGVGSSGSTIILNEPLASINLLGAPTTDNVSLVWNGSAWTYGTTSSGTDMSTVWANLAASSNEQINATHLSTALADYATQSWVGDSFLRRDANQSTSYQYTFSKTDDHAIRVGTIRGLAVGSQTGEFIHLYDRVSIGSPDGWGSLSAPSYGLSTYGGAWLAANTGGVGIGTTSPETKLDVNGIQQIYQRGKYNTAFKDLLLLKAQSDIESSADAWSYTHPTFGIGFRRYWTSSGEPYGETTCAGIYATISSSWRGGLVFRTKNNQTQGGTHDVTALRLAPSGAATFASSVTATTFIGSLTGNASSATKATQDGSGNTITSTYLKLSGGTLTGSLIINSTGGNWNEGIRIHPAPDRWCSVVLCSVANTGAVGTDVKTWSIHNNDGIFGMYKNGATTSASAYISHNGNWMITGGNVGIGKTSPSYKLDVGGSLNATTIYENDVRVLTTNPSGANNVLNIISRTANSWIYFINNSGRNVGAVGYYGGMVCISNEATYARIGVNDSGTPQYWSSTYSGSAHNLWYEGIDLKLGGKYLLLTGSSYTNGSYVKAYDSSVAIAVNGSSYERFSFQQSLFYSAVDIVSASAVTARSDIRFKDVKGYLSPDVQQIADASIIKFTWKDKNDKSMQLGCIAQEWQKILPWTVREHNGELTLNYGVAALTAAIATARKVVDLERKINELQNELNELKKAS